MPPAKAANTKLTQGPHGSILRVGYIMTAASTPIRMENTPTVFVVVVGVVAVYLGIRGPGVTTYRVSGYVKTDGTALPGATVTIDGKSAMTNSDGYYEIAGLEGNKSYALIVSKTGYENTSAVVQVGSQDVQADNINLKAAEVALPLTAITSALAAQEDVSADNVDIYFCVAAAQTDNYAVGAVVNKQKSLVFFYIESSGEITVENQYTATDNVLAAMTTITTKQTISRFTGYRIVPFNITQKGAAYSFNYFDGYDEILRRWGFGTATLGADGNIALENMIHTWI